MPGLRIGIDVGGTFTHGVALLPPGEVVARARTPTTHRSEHGVAAGVRRILAELLEQITPAEVELVAHSTTQATNALLEGDVAPVIRVVVMPPGEGWLARLALRGESLDLGGGHRLPVQTHFVPWKQLPLIMTGKEAYPTRTPVAVIQPLAGGAELQEAEAAGPWRKEGHAVVLASDITRVLGLAARARTATVNASMLPTMLATANYTEQAVGALLPGVPLQVVRSDGGAMSIGEMRRFPVLSILSGPAAGASAAVHRTGLSEVVFIEVGGTSTDVTLICDGRVRHRYATVGGQRLMVPSLDLRTVAVGGGSMLRADERDFGPRSAHIAGLPYLFQALASGLSIRGKRDWRADARSGLREPYGDSGQNYCTVEMDDGSSAALTITDYWLARQDEKRVGKAQQELGVELSTQQLQEIRGAFANGDASIAAGSLDRAVARVVRSIKELAKAHGADLAHFTLIGGGGGAPAVYENVAQALNMSCELVSDHRVISAIGAALAVTCVSMSKTVAEPGGADISELVAGVERRLKQQGAERVSTDYEYDPQRQVLTVTGRGSRPYDQDAHPRSDAELALIAEGLIGAEAEWIWSGESEGLWAGQPQRRGRHRLACILDRNGRALLLGKLGGWV
ncbi:hypothetical protein IIA79_05805, partial [bacterium]|nr:hypothetical protein [bacterium]